MKHKNNNNKFKKFMNKFKPFMNSFRTFMNKFLTLTSENHRVIKMILFSVIILSLIPTFIFLYLQKTFKYLRWMTRHEPQKHLWYAGFDTIVIISWAILGISLILFTLIGIKQLMDLRKENKKFDIKSPEWLSALSAVSALLLIPTIVSIVFDSILMTRHIKSSEYKTFKKDKQPLLGVYDICTMGILIALTTACQWLGAKIIPQMPQGGSFFEMQCIIAVITCIVLRWQQALIVLTISPLVWWITGGATFYGPISLVFDYHLAYLVFGFMCLINPLDKLSMKLTSNKYAQLAITAGFGEILLALCFTLKFFSHVIAGHYQFLTPWDANVAYNGPYVAVSFGITSGLFLAGLKAFLMLRDYGRNSNNKEIYY